MEDHEQQANQDSGAGSSDHHHADERPGHGRFSGNDRPRAWIAANVCRVAGGVLAEHWDVLQDESTKAESKSGLPMLGQHFAAQSENSPQMLGPGSAIGSLPGAPLRLLAPELLLSVDAEYDTVASVCFYAMSFEL